MKIQVKSSEIVILILVSLMSFTANLPDQMVGNLVDKKLLSEVRTGDKTVLDSWDNERDLDGELSDGDQLRVR